MIITAIFILFLPGFFLTFVFYKWRKIDLIERTAFSFILSMAVISLTVFYFNLIGVRITNQTVIMEAAGIMGVISAILIIQHLREKNEN